MTKIKIGIIGYGKLGFVLAEAVSKKHQLLWAVEKDTNKRKKISTAFKVYPSVSKLTIVPELIIISVNDAGIEFVSKEIARVFGSRLKDTWVVHCSGVLPVSVLSYCEKCGAKTACIHPYQTFFYKDVSVLKGIGWTIETKHNPELLKSFITHIGGKPVILPKGKSNTKVLHHLSAVFASNFLTTVLTGAGKLEKKAGMKWEEFIPPIVETTLNNSYKSLSKSDKVPLTGPIARADINTIKFQLHTLKNHTNLINTYIYLSLATLETAKYNKVLSKQKFAEIKEILLSSLKD